MQDLTLINADDDLSLHTSDGRMRRDPMDDMSSGASTLPRAKSTTARQSKDTEHTLLISSFTGKAHIYINISCVCLCPVS